MKPDLAVFLESYKLSGVQAYLLALVGMSAATALRYSLNPVLGDAAPYAIHAIFLLVITSLSGFGPGIFGLFVALASGWALIPPYDQPVEQKIADEVTTAVAGTMICLVTAVMRTSLLAAARTRREADFLTLEMHHRVKNLFAVVGSMITLSAREQPEAKAALTDLRTRLQALANAHDVAVNPTDFVSFTELVIRLMAPHSAFGTTASRIKLEGETLRLPIEFLTPLGLILNELSTNAAKYGALAASNGTVKLAWVRRDNLLEVHWSEHGADLTNAVAGPGCPGFGSLLVEASVAQLRGTIDRSLTDDGLRVFLSIPFPDTDRKQFRSGDAGDTQETCNPQHSSLSALRGSKRFFRRKPRIRDSRS